MQMMGPRRVLNAFRLRARRWYYRRAPLATAPDLAGRRFLFLGGLHRSGTSLLHRLLRGHPDTSGFANTGAPEDEGQLLQSVFPRARQFGGPGRFAFDPEAHLTESSSLISDANRDKLLRQWGAYYDLSKPVLLEKSPPNLIRARFFQALLPSTGFIFIVRHPIAVAYATQKWAHTSFAELLLHWCLAHRLMLGDLRQLDHALVLRYEDVVDAPQPWLDAAFRLADLTPIRSSERIENHNPRYFAIWEQQRALWGDGEAALEELVAPTLAVFGYRLDPPFVEPWPGSGGNHAPQAGSAPCTPRRPATDATHRTISAAALLRSRQP
jgi:Sulfotransferase family